MSQSDHIEAPRPRFAEWLTRPMLANRATYVKVAVAAALINVFGLATSLFSMTIYDRVLPNNATSSLVGLSIGMMIIIIFDFIIRTLRAYFVDIAGADVDRKVGTDTFDRLLAVRLDQRRGSTGSLTGTMRELETLRDFFTSATLAALVDVPFILLTMFVIAMIGGKLVLVPLLMVPLVVVTGLATFPAMDRLSTEAMAQGLNKQSVLVESIGGIETVKAVGARPLLARRWLAAIDSASDFGLRQRLVGTISMNVANAAQTLSYAGVIVLGVYMIETRDLTMGGLIACSLLSGRAVAPLASIAQLLSRLSQTRTAYRAIDRFMQQPSELPTGTPIRPAKVDGLLEFRNVDFRYPGAAEDAVKGVNLTIRPGERVGLIGRVGSGKSTLARLALGLYQPTDGLVLIDGNDLRQLDLTHLRGKIGTALQESVLLSGTIRDNIVLDRDVDDEEMLRISRLTGAHDFIGSVANGYDLVLADRGESLSGGQRQAISLARALVAKPNLLVFDEPTSAMDGDSEELLMRRLAPELEGRTVIVITHRMSLLRLVNRVILMRDGRPAMDGPRDEVLRRLQQPPKAA